MTNKSKPNILFLFPDQLRADYLGCYGAAFAKTPHIDKLCSEGIQYTEAISSAPLCIPARASLLTGYNCITTGVTNNDQWLRPDHSACGMPSWPELLSINGYHTEGIGKMHFYPWDIKEGFDHRVIAEDKRHLDIDDDYQLYLNKHGYKKVHGKENPGYFEGKGAACSQIPAEHQVDVWTANQTIDFIDSYRSEKPFACMVGFPGPHCPYDPPEELSSEFKPCDMPESIPDNSVSEHFKLSFIEGMKASWNGVDYSDFTEEQKKKIKAYYSALINQIDTSIGSIIESLKKSGKLENTVIILSSDHGDFVGDYGLTGKSFFLKPATHVPLIIRLPQGLHKKIDTTVSLTDLFSTILSLAGVGVYQNEDSIILPEMPNANSSPREYLFAPSHKGYMVLKDNYKYVRYHSGFKMLTNTKKDPEDRTDLYSKLECKEILSELQSIMEKEIDRSIQLSNREKIVDRGGLMGEGAFGKPGWKRKYPEDLSDFKTHI
jgi:arylsulfatase A-like enzyme